MKFADLAKGEQFIYQSDCEENAIKMEKISVCNSEKNAIIISSGRKLFINDEKEIIKI